MEEAYGHIMGDDDYTADISREESYAYSPYNRVEGGGNYDQHNFYYAAHLANDTDYVFVDSHVLGNPTLADVNRDGHMDLIMAVSYYFDPTDYEGDTLDYNISNYVAGGVACWNLETQTWTWLVHLDLTTDFTKFTALIHGSPTVADLDGDGTSEVIVGTSLGIHQHTYILLLLCVCVSCVTIDICQCVCVYVVGLLYVLDGNTGFVMRHFPMQFNQIQCQIAVADLTGDGALEMIVADMGGNLVVVSANGEVVWDSKVSGSIPHTPSVGDVNG